MKNGIPENRDYAKHSVGAPATIAALTSSVAIPSIYGSYKLDKAMESFGVNPATPGVPGPLSKYMTEMNPDALSKIESWGKLRPSDFSNPVDFLKAYAITGGEAASSNLFLHRTANYGGQVVPEQAWHIMANDPRNGILGASDRFMKERLLTENRMARLKSIQDRFANDVAPSSRFDISSRLHNLLGRAVRKVNPYDRMSFIRNAVGNQIEGFERPALSDTAGGPKWFSYAHMPEMAQGDTEAYLRLLDEWEGKAARVGREGSIGKTLNNVSDNLVEAIKNFKSPTYKQYAGKVFSSPEEYLNFIWGNVGKNGKPVDKGLYKEVIRLASEGNKPGHNLRYEILTALQPNAKPISNSEAFADENLMRIFRDRVGRSGVWKYVKSMIPGSSGAKGGLSSLVPGISLARVKPATLANGIRGVQDIEDLAQNDLLLQIMSADMTRTLREGSKSYISKLNMAKLLRMIRGNKFRAAMASAVAVPLSIAGLNAFRNRRERKK